jgi:hypothetical protein
MITHSPQTRSRRRRGAFAAGLAAMLAMLVSSVAMAAPVLTDPDPDLDCLDAYGAGWLTHYVTTVNTPGDSTDWWVSIEFTIADEAGKAANCTISLASYELPGPEFSFPQSLFDGETGTFAAGTHTLTVALPRDAAAAGCFGQYDFVFGPLIGNLTFDDRYADRQIRSRIVGSETCPEGGTQGGTSSPLPDTSLAAASAPSSAPLIFGVAMLMALGAVGYVNFRVVRAARRR